MFFGKKQTEFMNQPPMAGVPTAHEGHYGAMPGMTEPGMTEPGMMGHDPNHYGHYAAMTGMPTPGMPYEYGYENYYGDNGMYASHTHMGYACDPCGYCGPYYEHSTVVDKMPQVYVVKKGDTAYKIAKKFGLDWRELAGYNRLGQPDLIYPGERLFIPPRY